MAKSTATRVSECRARKREDGWRMYQVFASPADVRAIEKARAAGYSLASVMARGADAINRRADRR